MGSFDSFDVEIETAGRRVRANCGISGVGERAGLFATEAGDVMLVATESLVFGSLEFEAAKVGSNNGPHEIVCMRSAFTPFYKQ
jgi:hypothetical protein